MVQPSVRESWSSNRAFLYAAIGAAVGLGNIWRFPYVAGQNGGAAFVLVYMACVVLLGMPLMMAEILLGKSGQLSAIGSIGSIARAEGRSGAWRALGGLMIATPLVGLTYYAVVGGWGLRYMLTNVTGAFEGIDPAGAQAIGDRINGNPFDLGFWHLLFIVITAAVVARGVREGLERAFKWMVPGLFLILLILLVYSIVSADMAAAARFLFGFDPSKITPLVFLTALGQAFFSLTIAVGALITYGAYLPGHISIPRAVVTIAAVDTGVALLAGLAIFPVVFANDLEPGSGPTLIFATLPMAFGHMPGGLIFGTLFFLLLVLAALSSSIGMLEPAVSWLVEHRGLRRAPMTVVAAAVCWLIGVAAVLSFNHWKDVHPLGMFSLFEGKTIFDCLDFVTGNVMIPLGGFGLCVFVGWGMSRESTQAALGLEEGAYVLWRFLVRYVAPLALIAIAAAGVFLG